MPENRRKVSTALDRNLERLESAMFGRKNALFGELIPATVATLPSRARPTSVEAFVIESVMHEYDAIRSEIDTSLTNQVSILSFGAATVGLLVAAAGTLWSDAELLSALLFMFLIPGSGFMVLAVHAGELVRLMRAGYFLFRLECWINQSLVEGAACVLSWEHWAIREGGADVDRHNSRAIKFLFSGLTVAFVGVGFEHLLNSRSGTDLDVYFAIACLIVSAVMSLVAFLWIDSLQRYAYRFRDQYHDRPGVTSPEDGRDAGTIR